MSTQKLVEACTDHHGMNTRVDEDKHPNRRRHVTHASPHTHHGTGVMVSLERGAQLALGQDDESVENFVELAEVEDPAVKGEAFVPDPAQIGAAGSSICGERDVVGVGQPPSLILAVVHGVAKTCRTMKPSHAVDKSVHTLRPYWVRHTTAHDAEHACEGPCRVNGQENVVDDNKGVEQTGLAQSPGLFAIGNVVLV